MNDILLVTTTLEKKEDAEKLANILLNKRFAGCAQITGEATSLYWWKGEIERASEYILTLKSSEDLYSQLEQAIIEHHPYETPEIIAVKPRFASRKYKSWLEQELKQP